MPVDTTHVEYAANTPIWQRIRDCIAGEDAVKAAGVRYLPQPNGMDKDQYAAYVTRASFFGATGRTVQGLHGAIFRQQPEITVPPGERYQMLLSNIDLAGTPLNVLASNLVEELLSVGRIGVFTDMTPGGEPYLALYLAENIINWRERNIDNVSVPDQFVLKEIYSVPAADGFGSTNKVRYRVLELDENNLYRVRLFTKPEDGGDYIIDVFEPVIGERRLNFIPFNVISPSQLELAIRKSPIKELVDVNLSHYRTQADIEHGGHWTALPTPWVSGELDEKTQALSIGSMQAWVLPSNTSVGMLTLKSEDLGALFKISEAKENKMAQLGARLLEDQKKAAETAASKRLQYSGENSILSSIANTASMALTQNLRWAVQMMNSDASGVNVQINTDFFDTTMDPAEITALMALWQSGGITHDTLLFNLKKGEVLPPGRTVEEEKALISEEMPTLGTFDPAAQTMPTVQ